MTTSWLMAPTNQNLSLHSWIDPQPSPAFIASIDLLSKCCGYWDDVQAVIPPTRKRSKTALAAESLPIAVVNVKPNTGTRVISEVVKKSRPWPTWVQKVKRAGRRSLPCLLHMPDLFVRGSKSRTGFQRISVSFKQRKRHFSSVKKKKRKCLKTNMRGEISLFLERFTIKPSMMILPFTMSKSGQPFSNTR
mmetsp:Transcript_27848/g.51264  ORF Transcript_27848/g.51264 Transcript_27848/m.51264 type:complete len:191 (-) Transcript_27848:822-1394(-)